MLIDFVQENVKNAFYDLFFCLHVLKKVVVNGYIRQQSFRILYLSL